MSEFRSSAESHLWKLIAVVTLLSGVFFLALAWSSRGEVEVGNLALGEGLAGSFLLLTSVCAVMHSRICDALDGNPSTHSSILRIMGGVLAVIGFALIATAGARSYKNAIPTQNQIATGLAGSFIIMVGLIYVLTSRVLEAIGVRSPDNK